MKINLLRCKVAAWLAVALLGTPPLTSHAQSSAFTYQGRLTDSGNPHTGTAEFQFTLWDAASGGNQVAATTPTVTTVGVTNGLFTIALDFGGAAFNGQPRFLQLEVRTGLTPFALISPRQAVTAAPYAMRALTVASNGLSGGTYANAVNFNNAANSFSGAFAGDGSSLSNVNVATFGGLAASNLWQLNGNTGANPVTGAFLGTRDNLPLELRVNGRRALRVEYATNAAFGSSPNIIGGHPNNVVSNGFVGTFIGGGGSASSPNRAGQHFATVLGGRGNTASGENSTAMGVLSRASGDYSVAMGTTAFATGSSATAMGRDTLASGLNSTATGYYTTAGGDYSFAAGRRARANHGGSFVWADYSSDADFASTADNQFAIRAGGGVRIEGGTDAEPGSGGILTLGSTSGANLVLDNNEIMARNNGAVATLSLNFDGGAVVTGGALGVGRAPAVNALEVEGAASKTTSGSWLANSDVRIKREVQTVNHALDTLNRVRLVSFRYADDYAKQHRGVEDRRYLNVVAQEFAQVFPEHVKPSGEKLPDGSDILQVDIHPLTIYSAAAIQELNRKLEQKETEITELQTRLAKLEQLMNHKLNGGAQ